MIKKYLLKIISILFCIVCSVSFLSLELAAQSNDALTLVGQCRQTLLEQHIQKPSEQVLDAGILKGIREVVPSVSQGNWGALQGVFRQLQAKDSVQAKEAADAAISGMCEATGDPYTALLDKNDMENDRRASVSGNFTGIGVELAWKGGLMVVSAIEGSPAQEAGIASGDFITAVDGRPVKGLTFYRAGDLLCGQEGSQALLDLVRGGKKLRLKVTRRKLTLPGVSAKIYEHGTGYIKIGYFSPKTADQTAGVLSQLMAKKITSLILDLRSNPGGDFQQGLKTASLFKTGPLILVERRSGNKKMTNKHPARFSGKIAVLTDKGTASSAEIVAQSLKGLPNVRIIGQRTFGKAVIQTLYALPEGAGFRLTTGRYLGVDKVSVNVVGLAPDIEVSSDQALTRALTWLHGK
ncbi:MAG: S41 family peptidase [bacterium]|nr:S41 family peptidase [bacterium]